LEKRGVGGEIQPVSKPNSRWPKKRGSLEGLMRREGRGPRGIFDGGGGGGFGGPLEGVVSGKGKRAKKKEGGKYYILSRKEKSTSVDTPNAPESEKK